jgi:hypothetical protein
MKTLSTVAFDSPPTPAGLPEANVMLERLLQDLAAFNTQ